LNKFMDPKKSVAPMPTEAYNMHDVKFGGIKFNVWDVSGRKNTRSLWSRYYQEGGVDAILWVVDASSSDERLDESRKELDSQLRHPVLAKKPLYVLCNKSDVQGAKKPEDIFELFHLEAHKKDGRKVMIKGISAKTGMNVKEAMHELAKELKVELKHSS